MKLFIWEGNGISNAYHDDGTLVVLAETPEQARDLARAQRFTWKKIREAWQEGPDPWEDPTLLAFDGEDAALDREPDFVLDITTPKVVAFNGGGYD